MPWRRLSRWAGALGLALVLHVSGLWGLRDVWAPLADPSAGRLRKFDAVYARQVSLSAAPSAAARAAPPAPAGVASVRRAAPSVAPAASAVVPGATDRIQSPPPSVAEGIADTASQPASPIGVADAVSTPPQPAASSSAPPVTPAASAPPPFEWPRATRVRYRVLGHYRGEVHGHATVEWLRQAERYQAHLEVSAAGVFTRRMSSEGRITAAGLVPQRYVQTDEFLGSLFSKPRVVDIRLDGPTITLANGQVVPSLPMVQDTASQFIQFIYLLTTDPTLQRPGAGVDLALALPRSVRTWRYETGPLETVPTPQGPVDALHLRPAASAPAGDWTVEIWFAPQLQMLPVQFRLRQSDEVYFDLFIDQMPEQAER